MRRLLLLSIALCATIAHAQPAQPLTMAQIMADPDWIGPAVEGAWWRWDGKAAQYTAKREGATIRDTFQVAIDGGAPARMDGSARADLDAPGAVLDAARSRSAFIRNGDVFVRDLRSGALTQLTRSNDEEALPQWGSDGALVWRVGNDWFRWDGRSTVQAATPKAEDDPAKPPKPDDLRDRQLRLIETLKTDRDRRDAAREQTEAWRRADATRAAPPIYLGKDVAIADTALSPDGRWLVVVTTAKDGDAGTAGKMPEYVTESGYEEFEEVRTRVGRNAPLPHRLWLVDVANGKPSELKFDPLPGIGTDPLAALRKAAGKDPRSGNRDVRIETDGDGSGPAIHWSADSRNVAVLLRAVDNKDRWIATVDLAGARLRARHHLHDDAWINWAFNEFGWLPDHRTLWLVSEESGYAHLYTLDAAGHGSARALTSGKWEVTQPALSPDGARFYFLCNRKWPGRNDVCVVDAKGGGIAEVTETGGIESFVVSPNGSNLLLRKSAAYLPPQLAVASINDGDVRQLTDTRKPAFAQLQWLAPEIVEVPSKHGAGKVWGKYYGPKNPEPGRKYPVVMFVHGAGYLQNVHDRYPNYFREQMFHNLLVQQGYVVLDLDFRASEGYGRDWRTAIYRHMGEPELQDYLDGLDWIVANRQGDRDRAGIYGGSYGGFMAFMALFKQPGVFKAGAALRPVTDWSQYNHEYTSNILNTPELDPEAYKRSSPIEFAGGLQDHLLIAHGMIDDNVFFKDSIMLTQKLIELRKDKWTIAPYPLERHAYAHADAWYDQYRRIYELFETALK